jgi:PKD repeat protein
MTPVVDSRGEHRGVTRPRQFRSAYERKSKMRKLTMLMVCAGTVAPLAAFAYGSLGLQQAVWGVHSQDTTPPVAAFTATPSAGGKVFVNASTSTSTNGIASYAWNFGDFILSVGEFHNHTYMASGTYTITLNVTDTLGLFNEVSHSVSVTNNNVPPFPYLVYGQTNDSDGVTPLPGCAIAINDTRTLETIIGSMGVGLTISDADGLYSVDISPLFVVTDDNLVVSAVGPAGQTGSNTSVVNTDVPYLGVYITLTPTEIPEFATVMIPIAGMVSVFLIMRMASARAKK